MRRLLVLLVVALGVLGVLGPAKAQQTSSFTRPVVTVRTGAVQTVDVESSGLAPYVEGQSMIHLGKTFFGLALYGGLSYDRSKVSYHVVCFVGPCPDIQSRRTHLDLATGLRFGVFPRHGPVDAFVGVASHFTHRTEDNEPFENREKWLRTTTLESGVNVEIPVTPRLGITGGVLGFLPVRVAKGTVHIGDWDPSEGNERRDVDMSRYGFHLGVQYEL